MQNRSGNFRSAFKEKKTKKLSNKKTGWARDKHHFTTKRIYIYRYICKSTFISLIDALEWKQQRRGSLWSTNYCSTCTQHIPLIYYLFFFPPLVPLICMKTCPYDCSKTINKKTGDLVGPWGNKVKYTIMIKSKKLEKLLKRQKHLGKIKKKQIVMAERKLFHYLPPERQHNSRHQSWSLITQGVILTKSPYTWEIFYSYTAEMITEIKTKKGKYKSKNQEQPD